MKQLLFKKEALDKLLIGFDKTANAVTGTLGPKGRNVLLDDPLLPHITNDGATIAESISFPDKFENLGSWVVRNTSSQTNDDAGDGTTTTAVLLQEIVHKSLERPESPVEIKNSLQEACIKVVDILKEQSNPIDIKDIKKVALISSENEDIANIVTEVITEVGKDGVIVVEESRTFESSYEVQKGYELNSGFVSPYFANDVTKTKAEYDNIPVLVADTKISSVMDLNVIFDQLQKENKNELIIVCSDIDPQLVGVLVKSKIVGTVNSVVINAKGDALEDIAATTGATLISPANGITFNKIDINKHLGFADKVTSTIKKTLFVAHTETGDELADRLKAEMAIVQNQFQKEMLAKRVAKLTGGIAIIKIGAATDLDRVYKKHKTDDTVAAVKAALAEGVVEGGGMALWRIANDLEPKTVGEEILKKSLSAPLRTIITNAGKDYTEVINKMPKGMGYDAKNDKYVNMIKSDIIDPVKVTRIALENSVSNASLLITTHCIITDYVKEEK